MFFLFLYVFLQERSTAGILISCLTHHMCIAGTFKVTRHRRCRIIIRVIDQHDSTTTDILNLHLDDMEKLKPLIQTQADLDILIRQARKTDAVALDTEFIWERTYYPRLGLIQIALSDEDCFLIDPLAISDLQ
ncbi:MAG: hypothetical protein ACN4GW_20290, partial [Desulforhopalus sp.]